MMALASCKEIYKETSGTTPSPRQRFAVALQGEDLYLHGGSRQINYFEQEDVSQYCDDLYRLHVGKEELSWEVIEQGGEKPQGRDDHRLCAVGNRLFLYGGKDDSDAKECLPGLFLFHIGIKAWEDVFTPTTAPRTLGHTVDKVKNYLYLFGGRVADDVTVDMHILGLDDMKWEVLETKGECPAPRFDHSSSVVKDRYIYYFGGNGGDNALCNDLFIFDTDSNSWTCPDIKYDSPAPRSLHSLANHRDKDIYVFGGQVENGSSDCLVTGDFYKLSIQDRLKWKKPVVSGNLASDRCGHVTVIVHSHIYTFGGAVKDGDPFDMHVLKIINPSERDIVVDNTNNQSLNTSKSSQQTQDSIHSKSSDKHKQVEINEGEKVMTNEDFISSEARTSTPVSTSSRSQSHFSHGKESNNHSILSSDISKENEGMDSTLTSTSRSSMNSSKCDTTLEHNKPDLLELRNNTSKMIEEAFDHVKHESGVLEKEKKKLSMEKYRFDQKQAKQEKKMAELENEMLSMLVNHQKTVDELLKKRQLEDEKERDELEKIQKNVEELKLKFTAK